MALYSLKDSERVFREGTSKPAEPYRTPWRQDYARLIHCPSFRRLQGKTQVFPGHESDFYRNRLTHSLEVAQIAKSIAIRLNFVSPNFRRKNNKIEPDIVEFAGLAHDLGHPPFGHNGEEALDECMKNHGGFEGNAQSLRIVTRLEKKIIDSPEGGIFPVFDDEGRDLRHGLNLTYRSLAALIKYDRVIPERIADRAEQGVMKGYYSEDADLVTSIKKSVLPSSANPKAFKTIECSIMDIADDIAYSTYDLEDNFKARFLTPMGMFNLDEEIYQSVAKTIASRILKQYPDKADVAQQLNANNIRAFLFTIFRDLLFESGTEINSVIKARDIEPAAKTMIVAAEVQAISHRLATDGYHRVKLTSRLVQNFLSGIEVISHPKHPQLHQARFTFSTFLFVEVLKNLTYHAIIRSAGLQVVEYRGKDIVKAIFKAIRDEDGIRLLPSDFQAICKGAPEKVRMRAISDFIAGMTDRYAFEFYGRLYGTSNLTIHKPL